MMSNAQYRGGAWPEPVHVLEVMVDVAARQLGINPVELRRLNTLTPDMLPFKTRWVIISIAVILPVTMKTV